MFIDPETSQTSSGPSSTPSSRRGRSDGSVRSVPTGRSTWRRSRISTSSRPSPPVLIFSCNSPEDRGEKDTLANVRATGEFVFNLVSYDLREAMNLTSTAAPHGVDEFELAQAGEGGKHKVRPPRVAASPANLECPCAAHRRDRAGGRRARPPSNVVFGRVVGLHIQGASFSIQSRAFRHGEGAAADAPRRHAVRWRRDRSHRDAADRSTRAG